MSAPDCYTWYPATNPRPHIALLPGTVSTGAPQYLVGGQGVLRLDQLPVTDLALPRPIPALVSWSSTTGAYVAYEDVHGLWFGLGSSPERALADLAEVLEATYRELTADETILATPLLKQLALLRRMIVPCPQK